VRRAGKAPVVPALYTLGPWFWRWEGAPSRAAGITTGAVSQNTWPKGQIMRWRHWVSGSGRGRDASTSNTDTPQAAPRLPSMGSNYPRGRSADLLLEQERGEGPLVQDRTGIRPQAHEAHRQRQPGMFHGLGALGEALRTAGRGARAASGRAGRKAEIRLCRQLAAHARESCRPAEDWKLLSAMAWVVPMSAGETRAKIEVLSNTGRGMYSWVTSL
jgi:hypothetical protein